MSFTKQTYETADEERPKPDIFRQSRLRINPKGSIVPAVPEG